jgi:RNA polymerase sigma factor (sigma-70 family)
MFGPDVAPLQEELYRLAYDYALAFRLCCADADDCAMALVFKSLQSDPLTRFPDLPPTDLLRWKRQVARNFAIDFLRQRKRYEMLPFDALELESLAITTEANLQVEARLVIDTVLSRLPEHQRHAIDAMYVRGASTHEIAQAMQRSEPAVRQILLRARARFRHEWSVLNAQNSHRDE